MKATFRILILGACVAGALFAETGRSRVTDRSAGSPIRWVEFVPADATEGEVGAWNHGPQERSAPSALLETDLYTYTAAHQPVTLRLTYEDNGWGAPVTLYLYRMNRITGEKTYFSAPASSFAPAGAVVDLFGSEGRPILVRIPVLQDFVLFGAGGALGPSRADALEVGQYAWVAEIRDARGERVLAHSYAMFSIIDRVQQVTTDVTTNTTWSANDAWFLNKTAVFVRDGATLTIEPGTFVYGSQAQKAALVVERGATLVAEGTALRPIVFTTDAPIGGRARGMWGGLILNGRAPMNAPGGTGEGEGQTGVYGGSDPHDSSGVLRYVRVEYAGILFSDDNELNGIAFQGVGRGTVVDHVQVHMNQDDGVEFFGGTVDAKYLLLTGIRDDSMDWVEGWQGSVQFVVAIQRGDDADQGIEADNKDSGNDLTPRSNPQLYNVTFIGAPSGGDAESDDAILLREGTAGKIHNGIFAYFNETHIAIRDDATFSQIAAGEIVVDNNIFWMNGEMWDSSGGALTAEGEGTRSFITSTMTRNRIVDPLLVGPLAPLTPDVRPMSGSPALDVRYVKTPPDNGFFDTNVFYLGGVNPYYNWTREPWTTWSDN